MKRTLAILCVIACLCALCVPAMAAGTITVYVKSSWSQVNLYCWENGDMSTWPGTAMTKGADGLWSLEIPAGSYTNVIANDGTNQTKDLKMDGSADCWIDADNAVVYTDATFTTPFAGGASTPSTGLNSLAIVGSGIPGVGEWNPGDPAGELVMTSEGVWTKVIAALAGTTMTIKFAGNDDWNSGYNFGGNGDGVTVAYGTKIDLSNDGGSKDITLTTVNDGNVKFTIDLTGEIPTLLVEETTEEVTAPSEPVTPPEESGETYTVYAKVPDDWKTPGVWCWNDAAQNPSNIGAWPGTYAMTKGENGWWTIEIPVGYNNVLINNSNDTKTPDIVGLSGQDVWINAYTDPNAPVHSYEEITDIAPPADGGNVEVTVRPTKGLNTDEAKAEPKGQDLTVLLAIVGSVVIIAIAAVVVIVLKNKQKKA